MKMKAKQNKAEEFEHIEANCILDFNDQNAKFVYGTKAFHTEMFMFCNVTE